EGRREVAMEIGTGRRNGGRVGDGGGVLLQGPAEEFRIVGLFGLGGSRQFGAVTFAAFDLKTAQTVFDAPRKVDAVNVTAAPGTGLQELRARVAATLGPTFDVQTAGEI